MNAPANIPARIDSERDVSDAWMEQTDPENERGDEATALFEHGSIWAYSHDNNPNDYGRSVSDPILIGLRVQNDGVSLTYPREWAMKALGPEWVKRIEAAQYEALNG